MTKTHEKLMKLGLRVWEKGPHMRIYINEEFLKPVFGLEVSRYKIGNISFSRLNGERISHTKVNAILARTPYYDCIADRWFCHKELTPII